MFASTSARARRAITSKDLAESVVWGEPVELANVDARLLGSAPVSLNGSRWMAVDEDGRGFVVHVEASAGQASGIVRIKLHVFDVANPAILHVTETVSPGRLVSALAAPSIAISSGPWETRFTICFLGMDLGARSFESLYVASGTASRPRPGRFGSPVIRVYDVLEMRPAYNSLSNPSLFMDNNDHVHIAYTASPPGGPMQATVVAYMRAEWDGDPNGWRWTRRELVGAVYDASVAARWNDGQLLVVVACKVVRTVVVKQAAVDYSGVYTNVATGGAILTWSGWGFLSGVDVVAGAAGSASSHSTADPSAWVQGDGAFCVGYQERVSDDIDPDTFTVQPRVATNMAPEDSTSPWTLHVIGSSEPFGHFVCVSGDGERGLCVWESRGQNLPSPARWEVAIALLENDPNSAWIGIDTTGTIGVASAKERMIFPISFVADGMLFVAWFYVDGTQDDHTSGSPLDSLSSWPTAPAGADVSIRLVSGEITG